MNNKIYGLGIESSCDETGISLLSIVENKTNYFQSELTVEKNTIFSQIDLHKKYGGVVPEIASREHLKKFHYLLDEIESFMQEKFNINFSDLSYISVTVQPGLIGSLMLGLQGAKILSNLYGIPLVPVNHLEAHLSVWPLENVKTKENVLNSINSKTKDQQNHFPCLGLLVSGGNTNIYSYNSIANLEILGSTMDDALGEALDKAAKVLNLGYPGGPKIEKLANAYTSSKSSSPNFFPKLLAGKNKSVSLDFSYSGIKTSLNRFVKEHSFANHPDKNLDSNLISIKESRNTENVKNNLKSISNDISIEKICHDYQERCFELVIRNVKKALLQTDYKLLLVGGGVSANATLRAKLISSIAELNRDIKIYFPSRLELCTDNGAMIASLGYFYFKNNLFGGNETEVSSCVS